MGLQAMGQPVWRLLLLGLLLGMLVEGGSTGDTAQMASLLTGDPQRVSRVFRSTEMEQALAEAWRAWPPRPLGRRSARPYTFPGTIQRLLGQVGPSITDRSISSFCCNSRLGQLREAKKISVGVFGGSVTAGTGCSSVRGKCSWPDLFETMLRTLGWDATVHNCAVGGTTTDQSVELVLARACGAYDLYIVAHGANDDVEFSEKDTAEESMERVAHTIQDLVHAVRETVNNSLIVVWDEMPAVHFLHTNGSRFENAMLAHSLGAASVAAPSLSFFQSLYLTDYLLHPDDREYFRPNEVHPKYPAFLLIAAILADYIHASPLTMPPPDDHMVSHSCRREIIVANQTLDKPLSVDGDTVHVTMTHSGWNPELDTHGRVNWITHQKGEWMQLEFKPAVYDVAAIYMRSYSYGWGSFTVDSHAERNRSTPQTVSSVWPREASMYTRTTLKSGMVRSLRFESVEGKNQIRSLSFCPQVPIRGRVQPESRHRYRGRN